jgi:hypothetical protein
VYYILLSLFLIILFLSNFSIYLYWFTLLLSSDLFVSFIFSSSASLSPFNHIFYLFPLSFLNFRFRSSIYLHSLNLFILEVLLSFLVLVKLGVNRDFGNRALSADVFSIHFIFFKFRVSTRNIDDLFSCVQRELS